jgi:hypothetical protein
VFKIAASTVPRVHRSYSAQGSRLPQAQALEIILLYSSSISKFEAPGLTPRWHPLTLKSVLRSPSSFLNLFDVFPQGKVYLEALETGICFECCLAFLVFWKYPYMVMAVEDERLSEPKWFCVASL